MTQPTEIRTSIVHGREIRVRQLGEVQFALMMREVKVLQRFFETVDKVEFTAELRDRMISATARIFDLLESVVVEQDDRDFLMDQVTANNLTLKDLIGVVAIFESAPVQKPVAVRRGPGRPRKNAAK